VAVALMKGRTPIRVYTSGLVVVAAVAVEGAPVANPAAAAKPPPQKTSRRLSPARDLLICLRMDGLYRKVGQAVSPAKSQAKGLRHLISDTFRECGTKDRRNEIPRPSCGS